MMRMMADMKAKLGMGALAAALVFGLVGCACTGGGGDDPEPEDGTVEDIYVVPGPEAAVVGQWYGLVNGIVVCLDLQEGGTYSVTAGTQEPRTGTWAMDDVMVTLDGAAANAMVFVEDRLVWSSAGDSFGRESIEPYVPAALLTGADLESFGGYWVITGVQTAAGVVDAASAGIDADIYVEGTRVALGGPLFGDIIVDGAFTDGALTYAAGEGESAVGVVLQLQEDYLLRVTLDAAGNQLVLFLTSAELPGIN